MEIKLNWATTRSILSSFFFVSWKVSICGRLLMAVMTQIKYKIPKEEIDTI